MEHINAPVTTSQLPLADSAYVRRDAARHCEEVSHGHEIHAEGRAAADHLPAASEEHTVKEQSVRSRQ